VNEQKHENWNTREIKDAADVISKRTSGAKIQQQHTHCTENKREIYEKRRKKGNLFFKKKKA
jgi:hypothetical protein